MSARGAGKRPPPGGGRTAGPAAGATARGTTGSAATRGSRGSFLLQDLGTTVRRHPVRALGLVLVLYSLLELLSFEPQPHTGGDNAGYITLAHSLLERHTYQDLYDPAEPPHTKYPPVFPLLIAAGLALGLKPWVGLKLIGVIAGGGAIAATFLWLRRRGRALLALGTAVLLALSPGVLGEVHWILSDVPFWCFTALALWAFERLDRQDWRRFTLALAFTCLAYFTRSAGLPLVVAAAGWLAWRRRWRQLLAFVLVLGPMALLWWLRSRAAGGVQYAGEFWMVDPYQPALGRVDLAGLVSRVGDNVSRYVTVHLPILLRGLPTAPAVAATVVLLAFGVYGWARRLLRRARVAEIFLPLYLGLILLWPAVWAGERFVLPVLGLLLAYAGDGVVQTFGNRGQRSIAGSEIGGAGAAGRRRPARQGRGSLALRPGTRGGWAAAAAGALVALLAFPGLAESVRNGSQCTGEWRQGERYPCLALPYREYFAMAEWTGRELPDSAVVLSRIPRLFYVLSGLQGRNYPMASTTQALLATADSAHAHWVVFDALGGLAQRYLAPAILQRPQAFCIAQATPNGAAVLLGILPDAASLPDLAPAQRNEQPAFAACARPLGDQPRAAAAPPPQADSASAPPPAAPNSAAGRAP